MFINFGSVKHKCHLSKKDLLKLFNKNIRVMSIVYGPGKISQNKTFLVLMQPL